MAHRCQIFFHLEIEMEKPSSKRKSIWNQLLFSQWPIVVTSFFIWKYKWILKPSLKLKSNWNQLNFYMAHRCHIFLTWKVKNNFFVTTTDLKSWKSPKLLTVTIVIYEHHPGRASHKGTFSYLISLSKGYKFIN